MANGLSPTREEDFASMFDSYLSSDWYDHVDSNITNKDFEDYNTTKRNLGNWLTKQLNSPARQLRGWSKRGWGGERHNMMSVGFDTAAYDDFVSEAVNRSEGYRREQDLLEVERRDEIIATEVAEIESIVETAEDKSALERATRESRLTGRSVSELYAELAD